jgi:hypothetical protein
MKPGHSARESPAAPVEVAVVSGAAAASTASVINREILLFCSIAAQPS